MAFWECWDEDDGSFCCGCCVRWGQWLQQQRERQRWRRRRGLSKEDIEFLKMELRSIHGALCLVSAVPSEQLPLHLKDWADQSREVSYDIQDILDTFLVRVKEAHPDSSKGLVSKMPRSFLRYQIAETIIDVKISIHEIGQRRAWYAARGFLRADAIRVQEIAERRSRYQADTIAANATPGATSVDTGLLDQLVGTGGAMEEVIRMLSMDTDDTSNHQLKTVCIVGAGGMGKTTLARAVYEKLQPQFDCSAFVSLSQNPNISGVLSSILQQLNGKHISESSGDEEQEQLVDQLGQLLHGKRYLIAVDDIWDDKSWQAIRGAMVDKDFGSRIITTTRSHEVAAHAGGVYELKPLSNDASKILFYRNIFGSEVTNHEVNQLDGILVDKILKKCSGLPLAIVSVARVLASAPREEWYKVVNYIGSQLEVRPSLDDMRKILLQSYYGLPSHLRPCFLYTSIFPEDYEIRRDRLVWRWIAEGFIEGKEGCSLFEIGQKYLDELLNRSLIIEVDKDDVTDGMAKYYRVHDLVLELSCSLASNENFVTIFGDSQEARVFRHKVVRRLSLPHCLFWWMAVTLDMGHVRSVGVFGNGINRMPPLSSFKILRILDLEGCDLGGSYYNIEHLGKLFHLRYLGLRGTNFSQQLPKDIGNLRFLQILDLKGTRIRELPSTVALLHRLLCLYAEPDTRIPKGVGNLTSLEELTKVSVNESPSLTEKLNSLVELRVLDIVLQQDMSESLQRDFMESLCNLHKLQSLGIYGRHSKLDLLTKEGWGPPPGLQRFVAVDGWFSELPTWISDARNLLEVQISVRVLWREGLQSLGRLQELRLLCLSVEHMGERLAVDADAFPNLKQLRISAETCLVFRGGAMPKVEVLEFVLDVDKADGDFNWDLNNLRSLEKVTVKLRTGNSASANKEAEAALRHAVESHPNSRIKLEIATVTSQYKQIELVDAAAGNISSSSEIQEERYAL